MSNVQIKKANNGLNLEELNELSKEELIKKVQSLQAHNVQLKSLLAKSGSKRKSELKHQKYFDFEKCTFRHILLRFFYLGWDYHGYVVQEDTMHTIEHYLFEALIKTCLIKDRPSSNYHRCGRTDKGVSSFGQVISLDIRSCLSRESQNDLQNEIDYCKILNKVLPENIQCLAWAPVANDISARFDCKQRTYKYFFPKGNLNIEKMRVASRYLVGSHDYRNICKMDVGNGVVEFVRNINDIELNVMDSENTINEFSMFVITIKGRSFLWHQIRCLMGILFLIGDEKEDPEVILQLLDVDSNPRKPDYAMASEVPLNLFHCEYYCEENWQWKKEPITAVIEKLKNMWTYSNIKSTMIRCMLDDLNNISAIETEQSKSNALTSCLLQGVKSRMYIPLMKRNKCDSLEDKIQHFAKRGRIEQRNNK